MHPRGNQDMNTIYVELPPWSPSDTGAGSRHNRPREIRATQADTEYVNINQSGEEDQQDADGVVQLSSENPFTSGGRGAASRRGGAPRFPSAPTRGSSGRRQHSDPEDDENEQERGAFGNMTVLSAPNPFASRGNGGNRARGRGGILHHANTSHGRQGRDSSPSRRYHSQDDLDEDEDEDLNPRTHRPVGSVGRPGGGRNTSPRPPHHPSNSPPPPRHPNPRPPIRFLSPFDDDEQEQEEEEPVDAEPEAYSDGEPAPILSAVGRNAHLTRPNIKAAPAAPKSQATKGLAGGSKPGIGPANPQGSSQPSIKLTTAVEKAKMINALGIGNKSVLSASTDPSDISPLPGDKGKQPAEGSRAGPSGIRNEPILHGSTVPLKKVETETEIVYVPFGEVGRPGKRPKVPFPGYPGYPPYYPHPYPFETETEYIDVPESEHEHHDHHNRPHPHDGHHHHDHHHWPRHYPPHYPPPWAPVHNNPYYPYQPFNPAPPLHHRAPFVGPLYANIPPLPSLFDQARSAFYTLPVPPTVLLRDLQEAHDRQVPVETPPPPRTAPNQKELQEFTKGFDYICKTPNLLDTLPVLTYQECQPFYIDAVYRRLSDIVQVRFAERRGDDIINRVHVVQRNRLAYGTVMQYRPKLDVDLVVPGDYVLRRWALDPKTPDEQKPRTISKALKLDTAAIARGELDAQDLGWVIKAVLEQLNGSQDQFIFPGGNSEALKYIGTFDSSATVDGLNRIRLMSQGDVNPIRVNVFIKVAVQVNGQEVVVGVDQASAVSAGKYQMVKLVRRPNGPLGESPLSPIERSAIIALGWWKRGILHGDVPTKSPTSKPKLRASHFSIALKALHALDPSDELYVPHARLKTRPFAIGLVVDVMLKVVKYLKMAYTSPVAVAAAAAASTSSVGGTGGQAQVAEYLFPLASCGILEALYTQVASRPDEIKTLVDSGVMDDMIKYLEGKLPSGGAAAAATNSAGAPGAPGPSTSISATTNAPSTNPVTVSGDVQAAVGPDRQITGNATGSVSTGGMTVAGGLAQDSSGNTTVQIEGVGAGIGLKTAITSAPLGAGEVAKGGVVKDGPETTTPVVKT